MPTIVLLTVPFTPLLPNMVCAAVYLAQCFYTVPQKGFSHGFTPKKETTSLLPFICIFPELKYG
ncbi:lysophospholipase [Acetobacter orientalis]|uniref:Lysophospholipase n=1 Tax=Acetobacter orientalis TaxID=146474 RepID=A0A2Z5ZID9_9PROT|nr:lysophospholipase [Acetobacter orientalis]